MKISDIAINDTIITKDNIKGTVIQINSILYLNNMMSKKKNLPNYKLVSFIDISLIFIIQF